MSESNGHNDSTINGNSHINNGDAMLVKWDDVNKACKYNNCSFEAVEGADYCGRHHGGIQALHNGRADNRIYRLNLWDQRHKEFHESDTLKTVREEIAILKMTLEAIVGRCKSTNDLLIHSSKISLVVEKIDKLVNSCNKYEDRMAMTLDKSAIMNLAENITQIVLDHVPEADRGIVADKIQEAVFSSGRAIDHRDL